MTEAQFSLITLGVLLIASNVYWAWSTHALINKLMSRNFFEYQEARVTTDKAKKKVNTVPFAVDDMGSMSEFN